MLSTHSEGRGPPMNLLPTRDDEEPKGRTIYLLPSLWRALDEISDESREEDPKGKGYSRNRIIVEFLMWAVKEYRAQRAKRKAGKK